MNVRRALVAIFLVGAVLRLDGLLRPLDLPAWRECDVAAVARNFHREGLRPLFPRIDWRGTGPGFAEMEFPALSYAMALGYRLTGVDERLGRVLVYLGSLVALAALLGFAQTLQPGLAAVAAGACFALAPLAIGLSTSLQPEGWMLAAYVAAPWALWRWLEIPTARRLCLAIAVTAAAVLFKAPSAHLGLLFAPLVLARWGWQALARPSVWGFALTALLPAALWHFHAHSLWLSYGNSLGVSNESHWAGTALLTNPTLVRNIVRLDLQQVWLPVGLVLAALGLSRTDRGPARFVALAWLVAVGAYYLVVARTLSDDWADYYHVVAAAPVALLVGQGVRALFDLARAVPLSPFAATVAACAPPTAWWIGERLAPLLALALLAVLAGRHALAALAHSRFDPGTRAARSPRWLPVFTTIVAVLGPVAWGQQAWAHWRARRPTATAHPLFHCAQKFYPLVRGPGLLVVSGGTKYDPEGLPVAYDAPYFLYWLDRQGFTIAFQDQSLDRLGGFASQGARWFVAETYAVAQQPGFEAQLLANYRLVARCDEAMLFDLAMPGRPTSAAHP